MLWLRPLDALHANVIPEPRAGSHHSGRQTAISSRFRNQSLKKVRIGGGPPTIVCRAEAMPGGGAWNRSGVILFAPGLADGLLPGGRKRRQAAARPESGFCEIRAFLLWPQFLPDGQHSFSLCGPTWPTPPEFTPARSIRRIPPSVQLRDECVYSGVAAGDSSNLGYLLFIRERHLMEQSFDISKLATRGEPFTLADDSALCGDMALAPISVRAAASWSTRAWASPPSSWSGWTAAGSRSAK